MIAASVFAEAKMRLAVWSALVLGVLSGVCGPVGAHVFKYEIDIKVYYQGGFPADGKYLRENFFTTATPHGIAPKNLALIAEFSTGPNTPVIATTSCGVGEIQPGWTVNYRAISCNWQPEIIVEKGQTLFVSVSHAFAPLDPSAASSTFPVAVEAVQPYPDKNAKDCAPPPPGPKDVPQDKGSISVDVYQLEGAIGADGMLDQKKLCVVATPHGHNVTGLRLWGSLMARKEGKDKYVGSYLAVINNAPDFIAAGKPVSISPAGNNNAPTDMFVPPGTKLWVATTITFGQVRSASPDAVPVLSYGPAAVGPK